MAYETILLEVEQGVARVTLNRPEVRNAFDDRMLRELLEVFSETKVRRDVRVVVLTGSGTSFCAGADLNWMRRVKEYTYEENLRDSRVLADCLYAIYSCPRPTIARVNGPAIGGGTGLVAVCDIAVASTEARFSFSEVKIGIVPACISPYVVRRMGEGACREFFLTGERFTPERALGARLVNTVVAPEVLDEVVQEQIDQLMTGGPRALEVCKELLHKVAEMNLKEGKSYTVEVIASLRTSEEAQEGMAAYLEKRKPDWAKE